MFSILAYLVIAHEIGTASGLRVRPAASGLHMEFKALVSNYV